MTAFSIVIPTFNRASMLDAIISSLLSQLDGTTDVEILVCDSGSADGTVEVVALHAGRTTSAIKHLQTTNSLSRKRNVGLEAAVHEYVIFLDDDCVPLPGFIEEYRRFVELRLKDEAKVVLCGETRFPEDWVMASNYYRFRDSRHFSNEDAESESPLDFKTIVAMNMCVRKSQFVQAVQGFDETFIGYGAEDQEIGWRLQQAGFSIQACPAGAIHHEMSKDIRAFGDKLRRTGRDGALTLLEIAPEAAAAIPRARMLDPDYPGRSLTDKLALVVFRVVLAIRLHHLLSWLLVKTDRNRALYFPPAYRAYMACCYALGASQRAHRLSAAEAAAGWVGQSR